MLSASSPEIRAFVEAYEENRGLAFRRGRGPGFTRPYIIAEDRQKYISIDEADHGDESPGFLHSRQGRFLIDRNDGVVYNIKGYGKRGYRAGTVEQLTDEFRAASASFDTSSRVASLRGHAGIAETPTRRPYVIRGGLERRRGVLLRERSRHRRRAGVR